MPSAALILEFHGDRPPPRPPSQTMGYRDNACERHFGRHRNQFASYKFEQRRQSDCLVGCRGLRDQTNAALCRAARAHGWSRLFRRTLPANRRDRMGVELAIAIFELWSALRLRSGPATK